MNVHIIDETLLDEKLEALEAARSWSPRVISRLESFIRTADDWALFRVNPYQYAADRNLSEVEAVDLFLHAAKIGLFEMEWHLICRSCGHVIESFADMTHLHNDFVCFSCNAVQHTTLDDEVEVAFTLSARIRDNRFRQPESLNAEDYFLRYEMSKAPQSVTPGLDYVEEFKTFSPVLTTIEPQGRLQHEFTLKGQLVIVRARKVSHSAILSELTPSETVIPVDVTVKPDSAQVAGLPFMPLNLPMASGYPRKVENAAMIQHNRLRVTISNQTDLPLPVWIQNIPPFDKPDVPFAAFLTAKRLLSTQTFRDLFRGAGGREESLDVKDVTLLFSDLKGSTALYDRIGDAKAYFLVRQHFDALRLAITRCRGAIVKTIGDAVMAAFSSPLDAVQAAREMFRELERFNQTIPEPLALKIGIHRGHSIVVSLNEQWDYFGQTVNIAARVQALAEAGEICLTEAVYQQERVSTTLSDCALRTEQTSVKGVSRPVIIHRVLSAGGDEATQTR